MGHLSKHLLFALLGTAVQAVPGSLGGPHGGGRAGKDEGGGPTHGLKSHGGGLGSGAHSSGPSDSGLDWRQFLDLDKSHPECPADFPEILFYDNFANYAPGSQPGEEKWQYDLGHNYPGGPVQWGTDEIQSYTKDVRNIVITEDGTLRITPRKDPTQSELLDQWTSARIETTKKWDFRAEPGKKVRIQTTMMLGDEEQYKQIGIWPAFWSLGAGYREDFYSWPRVGEIDILESPNGLPFAWQVLHCGPTYDAAVPCNEPTGITEPPADFSRGVWHVVSVDIDRTNPNGRWQDEEIVWRIDGKVVFRVTGAQVGDELYWTNITHGDHMILLNVAVGGSFPNKLVSDPPTPYDTTTGGEDSSMWVKYVIVYSSS